MCESLPEKQGGMNEKYFKSPVYFCLLVQCNRRFASPGQHHTPGLPLTMFVNGLPCGDENNKTAEKGSYFAANEAQVGGLHTEAGISL